MPGRHAVALAIMRDMAGEGEAKPDDGASFIADGLASGAYDADGVDLTLIRLFLGLTPAERLDQASASAGAVEELRALNAPAFR